MNKTLTSIILAGAALLSTACNTPTRLRTPGHIPNIAIGSVSAEKDANYALKGVNIDGLGETKFYVNTSGNPDETAYIGKPYFGGSRMRIDLDERTAVLNPTREFVPVKYFEGIAPNKKLVTRFDLDTEGPYRFRAVNRDTSARKSPIGQHTQRNLDWHLEPLDIKYHDQNGKVIVEQVYVVGQMKPGTETVDKVFMIPKKGTILDIDIDSGSGFLERAEGYYEVRVMSPEDHAKRLLPISPPEQTFPMNTGKPAKII